MSANEIRYLIFEKYYKELDFLREKVIFQWNAWKKDLYMLENKLIEKIPDPPNAKEHFQSSIRNKTQNQ